MRIEEWKEGKVVIKCTGNQKRSAVQYRSDQIGSVRSWAAWTVVRVGIGIGNVKGRFHECVSCRVTLGGGGTDV